MRTLGGSVIWLVVGCSLFWLITKDVLALTTMGAGLGMALGMWFMQKMDSPFHLERRVLYLVVGLAMLAASVLVFLLAMSVNLENILGYFLVGALFGFILFFVPVGLFYLYRYFFGEPTTTRS